MTPLSRYEQETIINYNREEKIAEIYTRDPIVMRKLEKLAEKYPKHYILKSKDEYGCVYECPKKLIRFGAPAKELTEEEKQKRRELLAQYSYTKKND